jgi:hypothetical protein
MHPQACEIHGFCAKVTLAAPRSQKTDMTRVGIRLKILRDLPDTPFKQ